MKYSFDAYIRSAFVAVMAATLATKILFDPIYYTGTVPGLPVKGFSVACVSWTTLLCCRDILFADEQRRIDAACEEDGE